MKLHHLKMLLAAGGLAFLACSHGSDSPGQPSSSTPAITSFQAAKTTVQKGEGTTLTASFSGGTGSIANDVGAAVGAVTSGQPVAITPEGTTLYTLTVTAGSASPATAQVTVTVQAPDARITAPASVASGSTFQASVPVPTDAAATFAWTVGAGTITGGSASSRTITVTPQASAAAVTLGCTVTNSFNTLVKGTATVAVTAPGDVAIAGSLLVDLDVNQLGSTDGTWANRVTGVGDFTKLGSPSVQTVGGQSAMVFNGTTDAYVGPAAPASITGASPRTIEVWAYNPSVDTPEETVLAWGQRGSDLADCSLNWGSSTAFGAVTHYGGDLGWGDIPSAGAWHHLVYTYDGTTVCVYDNTSLRATDTFALATTPGVPINLAAQNGSDGKPLFKNEFSGAAMGGSLAIAAVRIHTGALTSDQVKTNFNAASARFGAVVKAGLDQRLALAVSLSSDDLTVKLFGDNNAMVSLSPKGSTFDFTPGDLLSRRVGEGNYHLGDLTLRTRVGTGAWKSYRSPNAPMAATPLALAGGYAVDLSPAMGSGCPLTVERRWLVENGKLILRFVLTNPGTEAVEIGALGAPMVFNNDFTNRSLTKTHETCSFVDPYIGGDAGYLQVTRVSGAGPTLLVYPEPGTSFEAYRHLRDDPNEVSVTFEGFYEWMAHSKAYVENDWTGKEEWNPGTSLSLAPGASTTYGFVMAISPTIRGIEDTLVAKSRPVAVAIPGTVLTMDQPGRLFVSYGQTVKSVVVTPTGAVTVAQDSALTPKGWQGFTLTPVLEGRARLVITYQDGTQQFIHTYGVPSQLDQMTRLADFHETHQWYTNAADPFKRANSYMLYDREADKLLDQESRQFDVGESDEVGAGPNLLMAMKNNLLPEAAQVAHLEQYVDSVLWGNLQRQDNYGVKASLFYWDPASFPNYYTVGQGWGWNKARGAALWRSYNYPHQASVYWTLYRLARNYTGLVKNHTWDWYLTQACKTGLGMRDNGTYNTVGLMDGSVFLEILKDMKLEGWDVDAGKAADFAAYESFFQGRAAAWSKEAYPFGSEMPWDSTGQEEVYQWCKYYGYPAKSSESLTAITAYTPTVPNWAYNGAARRYWDSSTYGKLTDIFRQSGHYGSSLNAIPVFDAFRDDPSDFYLLRIGYGANMNILPNINTAGHGSMCFTMDTAYMTYDPYTGDFGSAVFGYAYNAGAYAYQHADFGWLGFGAQVSVNGQVVSVTPKDAFRRRVYISTLGLWLTLDSGTFDRVDVNTASGSVDVVLSAATGTCPTALLKVSRPGSTAAAHHPSVTLPLTRGAYAVTLGSAPTTITLVP